MNLEAHLNELPEQDVATFRTIVTRLRAVPERTPSADLTDRILAAVERGRDRQTRRRYPTPWWGFAAAAAIFLALTLFNRNFRPPTPADAPRSGSEAWLAQTQEADGTWSPARHGGNEVYRPALTALAALALDHAPGAYAAPIEKACQALAGMQTAEGAFGQASGRAQLYNHAITTYALATLFPDHPALKPTLERAVAYIRTCQTPEGGWDYEDGSQGNAALSSWQLRALASAVEQGFTEANVPLRKGLRWLRASARDDGSIAYHRGSSSRSEGLNALAAYTLITAGKDFPELPALGQHVAGSLKADAASPDSADCYRDYAKVLAFESSGAQAQADAVRAHMLERRQTGVQDQWEKVGGQLYTTALTALVAKR